MMASEYRLVRMAVATTWAVLLAAFSLAAYAYLLVFDIAFDVVGDTHWHSPWITTWLTVVTVVLGPLSIRLGASLMRSPQNPRQRGTIFLPVSLVAIAAALAISFTAVVSIA